MTVYACAPEIRVFAAVLCFIAAILSAAGLVACAALGRRLLAFVRAGLAAALLAAFAILAVPQLYLWEGVVMPVPTALLPSALLTAAALGNVSRLPEREAVRWPLKGARLLLAICALGSLWSPCPALPGFAVCAGVEAAALLSGMNRIAGSRQLPYLMARLAYGLPVGVALYGASGRRLDENEAHMLFRTRVGEACAFDAARESPALIRSGERAYSVRAEVYRSSRRVVAVQDVTDHEAALAGERTVVEQLERRAHLTAALADQEAQAAILGSREYALQQLHDSVGQALATVNLSLALPFDPLGGVAAVGQRITVARVRLEECLGRREGALPLPLEESLALLAEVYAALDIEIKVEGETPALTPRAEISLLAICQEAVANAVRHGKASKILIAWQPRQGVLLEIANEVPDGSLEFAEGVGLLGMRRRASEAGCHIAARICGGRFVLRVQKDESTSGM